MMKMRYLQGLILLALLFEGCAHQQYHPERYSFGDKEVDGWRRSVLEAINSPEEWARIGVRITKGPLNPNLSNMEYTLGCPDLKHVQVFIGCITARGDPITFVKIIIDRGTWRVSSMSEER